MSRKVLAGLTAERKKIETTLQTVKDTEQAMMIQVWKDEGGFVVGDLVERIIDKTVPHHMQKGGPRTEIATERGIVESLSLRYAWQREEELEPERGMVRMYKKDGTLGERTVDLRYDYRKFRKVLS